MHAGKIGGPSDGESGQSGAPKRWGEGETVESGHGSTWSAAEAAGDLLLRIRKLREFLAQSFWVPNAINAFEQHPQRSKHIET